MYVLSETKMAQQQNESINDLPNNENNFISDVSNKSFQQNGSNIDSTNNKNVSNNLCGNSMAPAGTSNMNEHQKGKSPQNAVGSGSSGPTGNGGQPTMPSTLNDSSMHVGPYGEPLRHPPMPPTSHPHHHLGSIPGEHRQPDEQLEHMYNPQQSQPYGRYHDPNIPPVDMYSRYHQSGKPATMVHPNRPPQQRYIQSPGPAPGASHHPHHPAPPPPQIHQTDQSQQQNSAQQPTQPNPPIGPTPTLNSLLQSHQAGGAPPPHHRYSNSYDQQQPHQNQQPPQGQLHWTPQQMGRGPPPNTVRFYSLLLTSSKLNVDRFVSN